jgi:hypothetical protein
MKNTKSHRPVISQYPFHWNRNEYLDFFTDNQKEIGLKYVKPSLKKINNLDKFHINLTRS